MNLINDMNLSDQGEGCHCKGKTQQTFSNSSCLFVCICSFVVIYFIIYQFDSTFMGLFDCFGTVLGCYGLSE